MIEGKMASHEQHKEIAQAMRVITNAFEANKISHPVAAMAMTILLDLLKANGVEIQCLREEEVSAGLH